MDNKLSACLIVKDEGPCIEKCLKSVRNHVDEIVVVDTGSADNTVELAKKYADKVFNFKWVNDFSAARNFSLKCAGYDWILVLDADEIIQKWNKDTVGRFIHEDGQRRVGSVKIISTFGGGADEKRDIERINRLFNRQYFNYKEIIHEQVSALDGRMFDRINMDITLIHSGYENDEIKRKNKAERNRRMLKQALEQNGDSCYLLYQLGKSYDLEKNYNDARECYAKAISLIGNLNYVYVRELIIAYVYILVNAKDYKGAMAIEKYRGCYGGNPDYNFLLAYVYMMNGLSSKAIETFLKCTRLKNGEVEGVTSWLPFYNIGVIYECHGKRAEALEYYGKCGDYVKARSRIAALLKK
jgi:glycosyltransferase involved in cell wall biosynthesis